MALVRARCTRLLYCTFLRFARLFDRYFSHCIRLDVAQTSPYLPRFCRQVRPAEADLHIMRFAHVMYL